MTTVVQIKTDTTTSHWVISHSTTITLYYTYTEKFKEMDIWKKQWFYILSTIETRINLWYTRWAIKVYPFHVSQMLIKLDNIWQNATSDLLQHNHVHGSHYIIYSVWLWHTIKTKTFMPLSDGLIDNVVPHRFQSISELIRFTKSGMTYIAAKTTKLAGTNVK